MLYFTISHFHSHSSLITEEHSAVIMANGGLTVPVHHHQQLEFKHVAVGYMIPYLPDLLYTLAGFR